MTTAVAVCIDGPSSTFNADGDEVPEWQVYTIDAEGNEVGPVYYCDSYHVVLDLGRQIAHDRRLELNDETSPE